MPVANVKLYLSDDVYKGILSGALKIAGGVVRDKKGVIRKHAPKIAEHIKENGVSVVKNHKGVAIGIGVGIAVVGAVSGGLFYLSNRSNKKAQTQFESSLKTYLDAAKSGTLNVEILDKFIFDLDKITKNDDGKSLLFNLSIEQFSILLYSVFDYTKRLAEANGVDAKELKVPNGSMKNMITYLKEYLNIQKSIIEKKGL